MSHELVHLNALSRRLRVPSRWLRTEALAGRLPHIQAGPRLLFDLKAVEKALAERAACFPITTDGVPKEVKSDGV